MNWSLIEKDFWTDFFFFFVCFRFAFLSCVKWNRYDKVPFILRCSSTQRQLKNEKVNWKWEVRWCHLVAAAINKSSLQHLHFAVSRLLVIKCLASYAAAWRELLLCHACSCTLECVNVCIRRDKNNSLDFLVKPPAAFCSRAFWTAHLKTQRLELFAKKNFSLWARARWRS